MIGPFEGIISAARDLPPFNVVFLHFDGIDLIVWKDLSILFAGLVNSSEHDGKLSNSGYRVSRPSRRCLPCVVQL